MSRLQLAAAVLLIDFFGKRKVGIIAQCRNIPFFDRFDDGAAGLVNMGAVGVAAAGKIRLKFLEVERELFLS